MKRRVRLNLFALAALLACLFLPTAAFGQTSRGTVSGNVTDPNGAVVAGAAVTLTNTQTNVSRTATTNDEGAYRFDAVELGTYTVKVAAGGFGELAKTNVEVLANQIATVDAQLQPGGQNITVDVTADSGAILQTEAPVRGGNIEAARITELPFAGRNPVSLALTLPGVSSNRYGFGVGTFSVN
ncbi:MAG TPA: carboxypeptidase-like regulatory domain-containing protein, partial [Pyrinomonadaceae bacterium]|nr:carboxypeptidase-like regulatory domain-containing protein [Pyrinomonadaceae bacterium]